LTKVKTKAPIFTSTQTTGSTSANKVTTQTPFTASLIKQTTTTSTKKIGTSITNGNAVTGKNYL
jgi:hypothetical protein